MFRFTMLAMFLGQIPFVFVEPKIDEDADNKIAVSKAIAKPSQPRSERKVSNQAKLAALNSFLSPPSLAKFEMTPRRMRYFLDIKEGLAMDIKALQKEFRISSPDELTNEAMRSKYDAEEANIINDAMESTIKLLDANQRRMLRETELRITDVSVLRSELKRFELSLESRTRKTKTRESIDG